VTKRDKILKYVPLVTICLSCGLILKGTFTYDATSMLTGFTIFLMGSMQLITGGGLSD